MLRSQAAAAVLLVHISPFRDTDKRVMRFIHVRGGEIDVIGGHQRDVHGVGHLDKAALGELFGLRLASLSRMALQLQIKPVIKDLFETGHHGAGGLMLAGAHQAPHRPVRPAGETDQPSGTLRQFLQCDLRQLPALVHIKTGGQLHEVFIALFALAQQHNRGRGRRGGAPGRVILRHVQIDLTAHDGLNARVLRPDRELQRRKQAVGVGDGDGRHAHFFTKRGQFFHAHGPLQQRVFRVGAQVNESGSCGHCHRLSQRRGGGNTRQLSHSKNIPGEPQLG